MLITFLFILLNIGIANNFKNMPVALEQPDGSILNCLISGDEFYQRLHDDQGYTITQHPQDGY